jgi:hypothetical protein
MTMLKALLLPFDEDRAVEVIDFDDSSYQNLYPIVAPESRMFTAQDFPGGTMYGDDEGLLWGDPSKRINARAMQLLGERSDHGIEDFMSPLVGDWLVFGPVDAEGNNTSVPQDVIDFRFTWTARRPSVTGEAS